MSAVAEYKAALDDERTVAEAFDAAHDPSTKVRLAALLARCRAVSAIARQDAEAECALDPEPDTDDWDD